MDRLCEFLWVFFHEIAVRTCILPRSKVPLSTQEAYCMWSRLAEFFKVGSQYDEKASRVPHAMLQCKDRLVFYPCDADAVLDTSDYTYNRTSFHDSQTKKKKPWHMIVHPLVSILWTKF